MCNNKLSINEALKILKLNDKYNNFNIKDLSLNQLKKQYHIQALHFHPDKNKNLDSNKEFINIKNAYDFLYNILNNNQNVEEILDYSDNEKYSDLIVNFINLIIDNLNNNDNKVKELEKDIKKFKGDCIEYSYELIENFLNYLNVEILEEIYSFLSILSKNKIKNIKNVSNISQSTIDIILIILEKKLKNYNIYIITPELKNILNNEIYKLTIDNEIIYIPLWHKELNYKNNIIKIQPILRENEKIDENNNLILDFNTNYEYIIKKIRSEDFPILEIKLETEIDFYIENLKIPLNELKFIKNQHYFFKNNGISLINNTDIMDISKKGNIIINLIIE